MVAEAELTEKFTELFIYISQELAEHDNSIGKVLCLIYIADLEAYKNLGQSITGTRWQKGSNSWPVIPVPDWWEEGYEEFLDSQNLEVVWPPSP